MQKFNLNDFFKGWIVGHFNNSIFQTSDFEVAVKHYKANDYEQRHYHKIATEITVIVSGEVEMNGVKYMKDDIILIEPEDDTDFKCLTDVSTVVIKCPSVDDDKFILEN